MPRPSKISFFKVYKPILLITFGGRKGAEDETFNPLHNEKAALFISVNIVR
jgi:hypothetical protein